MATYVSFIVKLDSTIDTLISENANREKTEKSISEILHKIQPLVKSNHFLQKWEEYRKQKVLNFLLCSIILIKALSLKNKGNEFLTQESNNEKAILYFTLAILLDPNHLYYSNRSSCYANLHFYKEALEDADFAIQFNPEWAKVRIFFFYVIRYFWKV